MTTTSRSIRSMIRSRHFRRKNGLSPLPSPVPKKPKNWELVRKLLDTGKLPEDDEQKPDE